MGGGGGGDGGVQSRIGAGATAALLEGYSACLADARATLQRSRDPPYDWSEVRAPAAAAPPIRICIPQSPPPPHHVGDRSEACVGPGPPRAAFAVRSRPLWVRTRGRSARACRRRGLSRSGALGTAGEREGGG